jgi:hypothetical protein
MTGSCRFTRLSRFVLLTTASVILAGCGGSTGGGPVLTPPPVPTPTPTPTPVPTPTPTSGAFPQSALPNQFNTAEMRRSDGPQQHNAHVAWAGGTTGAGVTIAVIDTGIDVDSPEFAGRLSASSTDLFAARNALNATDDHGTTVAMIAAAARDDTGVVGMAWGATILAIRTDEPNSCTSDGATGADAECAFNDSDIARGIDYAMSNGAKVINISLGGGSGASAQLQQSVRNAAAAGALVVIAAGNEGFAALDEFGQQLAVTGAGSVLVVGSVDENYQISDFSNRPGTDGQYYLTARGDGVCCEYRNGTLYVDNEGFVYVNSGTSFAAPQVAGAAALLAQAFPNLTGQQIAEILLRTAFDAGDAGTDPVYGRGILNIAAAMQPVGTTGIAGQAGLLSLGEPVLAPSPAIGDALGPAALGSIATVITDEYGRAFDAELPVRSGIAQGRPVLHDALVGRSRSMAAAASGVSMAFTVDDTGHAAPMRLAAPQAEQARVLAARVAMTLSPRTQFGFAYAQSANGLVAQLQGQDRPAFMIAGDALGDDGLVRLTEGSVALRHQFGGWGLTLSAERGRTWANPAEQRAAELRGTDALRGAAIDTVTLAFDRRLGVVDTALSFSWMAEEERLLGLAMQKGFGLAGADSLFVDAGAGWSFAQDWRLGGSARAGRTTARGGGTLVQGSRVMTSAFAFDVARANLLARGDRLAFRVSQPLRVESGGLNLALPVNWDYATLTGQTAVQRLNLVPTGREIDAELAWQGPFAGGSAGASLFWRRDPGHVGHAPNDKGMALRWGAAF